MEVDLKYILPSFNVNQILGLFADIFKVWEYYDGSLVCESTIPAM